jgi:hypothetical protein
MSSKMKEPDFFLWRWQCDDDGSWIDSIYKLPRELPPVEQHRRDWCQCALCQPEHYSALRNQRTKPPKSRR